MQRSLGTLALFVLLGAAFTSASAQPANTAAAAAAGAAAARALQAQAPHAPAPYETFVRGANVSDGLIAIVKKDGKVYFSLKTDQIGKDFIETSVPATGLGGFRPAPGEPYVAPARIIRFERVDNSVVLRWPNTFTITAPNTPEAMGAQESLPNSIVAVQPIVAADDQHIVFAADPFLGDVADLSSSFEQLDKNPMHAYHLDPTRSLFTDAKSFPENDVLRVDQTWVSMSPPELLDNVPDARSVEVRMTYNLIQAPDDGYMPRIDDPRVGYFSQPLLNFSTDDLLERDTHYIARWNFGKRTSSAPFTATNPIVFYISNDVPVEYRAAFRDALLTWNDAFRKIGIENAVQVQQQPSDPSWDADDIRHNMVRWFDSSTPQYGAEALIVTDPRSGEEINIGVNFDAAMGPSGRLTYKYQIAPARGLSDSRASERAFDEAFVRSIMLHESGHDLGLQHNFIGSMAYTAKELQSPSFTHRYGVGNSVMEYSPINLWPKGTPQGDYVQEALGPYDYYAVKYGYAYIPNAATPAQELPTLRQWASRWTDPHYRFASDEDAGAFSSGHAIDPRVVTYDLTDKPLEWCNGQMRLMSGLMDGVNRRFPEAGMPYDEARAAFLSPMRSYLRCATMAAHTIGGEYVSRALKGDPRSTPPLQPVSIGYERQAWNVLANGLFSDAAWRFNPHVLDMLVYSERSSLFADAKWAYNPPARHDVSVVTAVNAAQAATLAELFSPLRLQRLDDMTMKYGEGKTMTLADLFDWSRSTILGGISSGAKHDGVVRRNLQTAYVKMLADMWTNPKPGTPSDAQALARLELTDVRHAAAAGSQSPGLDEMSRAHLQSLEAIADQALSAHASIGGTSRQLGP